MKLLKEYIFLCFVIALVTLAKFCNGQSGECIDSYGTFTCQAYVQTGQCEFVASLCQLSCGVCSVASSNQFVPVISMPVPAFRELPQVPSCFDQDSQCQNWAISGYCTSSPYVQNNCAKSCNLCYSAPVPTPGGMWHSWGAFGPCSVTCGEGERTRYRTCATLGCFGSFASTEICDFPPCRSGVWSNWQPYLPCSVTCGRGQKTRYRSCNGFFCVGSDTSTNMCDVSPCRPFRPVPPIPPSTCTEPFSCQSFLRFGITLCSNAVIGILCKKSCGRCTPGTLRAIGVLGPWSKYSACSKTCGKGTKTKTRKCLDGIGCFGENSKTVDCELRSCKGAWSKWGKFSSCSATCGNGKRTRKRTCISEPCVGTSVSRTGCKLKECTGWGPWTSYSKCSKICGGGTQTKSRVCKTGKCLGLKSSSRNCNVHVCTSRWSICSKSCGVGTRYKFDSSSCKTASNPACLRTFEECNTQHCSSNTCPLRMKHRFNSKHACCFGGSIHRIINGKEANIEDWPWMALIKSRSLCGGTIVGLQWILTAAHCLGTTSAEHQRIQVFAGIGRFSQTKGAKPYLISKVYIHEKYQRESLLNDIALIKLKEILTESSKVKPIQLPFNEETPTDSTCYVAGWGLTDPDPVFATPSERLRYTGVQVLDVAVCQKPYKQSPHFNSQTKSYIMERKKLLCAGSLTKRNDACMGDSGGPLICQRCSTCDWYIAGVTSFGPDNDCGKPGFPGMYSKVKAFEYWIYKKAPNLKGISKSCSYKYGP